MTGTPSVATAPTASRAAAAAFSIALLAAVPADAHGQEARRDPASPERSAIAPPLIPVRRPDPMVPAAPPPLPAGADTIRPLTLTLRVRKTAGGRPAGAIRQTVTRTADRVHVAGGAGGPEWLFERNPVDSRRVSGYFVDHGRRTIVFYSEADLDLMLGIPGWTHVLTLGCDERPSAIAGEGGSTRVIAGIRFRQEPSPTRGVPGAWWNAEQLLPAECTRTDAEGATRLTLEEVGRQIDSARLRSPAARFPEYRSLDLAEWLEGH